jgi:hypothetical protein
MRLTALAALLFLALPASGYAQGTPDDQVPLRFIASANPHALHSTTANAGGGVLGNRSNSSVLGVDSIPNWSSYFYFPGLDSFGNTQFTWQYTMVGHSPFDKGDDSNSNWHHDPDWEGTTTRIGAPVIPVNLDLRNFDGSPRFVGGQRLYVDATRYVAPVLSSPVFSKTFYDSSESPTQFADSVQRAEFFHKSSDDWHTLLHSRVGTTRTLVLIRGTYRFALNSDGSCCAYVLIDEGTFINGLFPSVPTDTSTVMGAAENSGDITTKDISSFLFPNAYLYTNGDPTQCCIIGFHSYDVEPGTAANGWLEKRYVMNYASWVTSGNFGDPTFADIAPLSHEITETFNDPFVNNATPWWLAPNGNCQNDLETGDGIEGLPNAQFPVSLNGYTWHPQNETLLQWFAGVTPSSAIHHAYSYPDTTVLAAASTSQKVGCM